MAQLTKATKLGFGVGDLGGNLLFTTLSFNASIYLTDTVGLAPGLAGAALMIGKLWDAGIDPLVGSLSDRTRTKWGRRRPYLIGGALPLAAALVLFFTAPALTDPIALFWWALLTFAALNTAFSFVNIPYGAITPELTDDYHERSSLNGYRFMFAAVGTLIGATLVGPIVGAFPGDRKLGYAAVGLVFGGLIALSALVTGFSVREKVPAAPVAHRSLWTSWAEAWGNRPFRVVLLAYTFHILGITVLSGMLSYYFLYVLKDPGSTTLALGALVITALAFIPVSVAFSKKFGKIRTYQVAMAILATAALVVSLGGAALGPWFVIGVMVFAGVGQGFSYVPPYALLPDAIEVKARQTGVREEGAYYGIWNVAVKLAQAGALAGALTVLGWAGYQANHDQGPAALTAITALVGPAPAVLFLVAALLLFLYPYDEKSYQEALKKAG